MNDLSPISRQHPRGSVGAELLRLVPEPTLLVLREAVEAGGEQWARIARAASAKSPLLNRTLATLANNFIVHAISQVVASDPTLGLDVVDDEQTTIFSRDDVRIRVKKVDREGRTARPNSARSRGIIHSGQLFLFDPPSGPPEWATIGYELDYIRLAIRRVTFGVEGWGGMDAAVDLPLLGAGTIGRIAPAAYAAIQRFRTA